MKSLSTKELGKAEPAGPKRAAQSFAKETGYQQAGFIHEDTSTEGDEVPAEVTRSLAPKSYGQIVTLSHNDPLRLQLWQYLIKGQLNELLFSHDQN